MKCGIRRPRSPKPIRHVSPIGSISFLKTNNDFNFSKRTHYETANKLSTAISKCYMILNYIERFVTNGGIY